MKIPAPPPAEKKAFDWRQAHARLERARRTLETGRERTAEEIRRVLSARAQALARPPQTPAGAAATQDLVVFSLSGESYGIDRTRVVEVVAPQEVIPLPGAPPAVCGVINHRGRILALLDLRALLKLPARKAPTGARVVVVRAADITLGILADAVAGVETVGVGAISPPPKRAGADEQPFIQGVTAGLVVVVDPDILARDPRIVVNEEVV